MIIIIEGGITVVGEELDCILSIPWEDMQIMNSSVTGTSLARFNKDNNKCAISCILC